MEYWLLKKRFHTNRFISHKLKAKLVNILAIGQGCYESGSIEYFTDSPVFRSLYTKENLCWLMQFSFYKN